jgi:L,D-transpeptidase catalytic domain
MRRTLLLSAALLALPASAHASPTGALHVASGLRHGQRVYAMRGQRVLIQGARPFAEPGVASASVDWRGHQVATTRSALRGKLGAAGGVLLHFTPRRAGTYTIAVKLFKEPDEVNPVGSALLAVHVIEPHAQLGSHGLATRLLQAGLRALAYVTPLSGRYDDATGRAVLAFRKVNGMARTESASRKVFEKLFRGRGGFKLAHPGAGRHAEFDWSRQVLVLAQGGRPVRIYHASSGKPSTPTVFGTFHFYSKTPGTNSKGMVDSNYFIRGYAVHGYPDVPPYAASHGCIRVPIPDAASIFDWIHLGATIFVYR